ncbi:hypothetical protein NW754_014421 [Fusarium falciforme]|nr:hypothetical protein NW754_014421 [Fusarium falciforme]
MSKSHRSKHSGSSRGRGSSGSQAAARDGMGGGETSGGGGNDAPKGYPGTAQDDPCAFLVKVFIDPDNPGCTAEHLKWVEWNSVLVRESSRSH